MSDLGLFPASGKLGVFSLFSKTVTQGGSVLMDALFRTPIADAAEINWRAERYRFFSDNACPFPVDSENMGTLAFYLENEDVRTQIEAGDQGLGQRLSGRIAADPDYAFVQDGVQAALRVFGQAEAFLADFRGRAEGSPYADEHAQLSRLVMDPAFAEVRGLAGPAGKRQPKLAAPVLSGLDKAIRFRERGKVLELLALLHRLDGYLTVGKIARERGFCFGRALPADTMKLGFTGVYHPHVEGAVANDLSLDADHPMLFLTGANMAGKSTLMKALGIALYLGHLGFPVPARDFAFSVCDGLYTSINLADNLQAGASHYYAEVLRVKEVATQLAAGKRLFLVFDELFRGTNVKDAYDATLAVTRAFAGKSGSQFVISTHIMEAGETLRQEKTGIRYLYLPTEMDGHTPTYPRILREGITADRHGMQIIRNEGVLGILEKGLTPQATTSK